MKIYPYRLLVSVFLLLAPLSAVSQVQVLLPDDTLQSISGELSGIEAKRNLDRVTLYHRTRASSQFRQAAEFIQSQLKQYGFDDAVIREYPADGNTMFGTQKSRPAWDVGFAALWEVSKVGESWVRQRKLADWSAMPLSLAQDSLSGDVTAGLVDVGAGTSDVDYTGKDIKGQLVLTSSQPEAVQGLAVSKYGAAGIISYAPNQRTAWWKEDDNLVRWGHLSSFPKDDTFAFMISLGEARALQSRLDAGENLGFHAKVTAHQFEGQYALVDALIKGTDQSVGQQEVLFSCHLDHPRPGANDNASGCVSILEVARTLRRLIDEGVLPKPRRSLRFIWPAEIEGSLIYLSSRDDADNIKANIHLDMVGGGPVTKAVFRVSGGPMSTASFIADVGHEAGKFVNDQTLAYASGQDVAYPLVSKEGGKEPLMAVMEGLSLGSDHQIFNESSWGIPGLYLHDWPDRYIHTNFDSSANIDPSKLKRSAFIAAISGWYLAHMDEDSLPALLALLNDNAVARKAQFMALSRQMSEVDAISTELVRQKLEIAKLQSIENFVPVRGRDAKNIELLRQLANMPGAVRPAAVAAEYTTVYSRNPAIKGPMNAFGYSYLEEHLSAQQRSSLRLMDYSSQWRHDGGEYAYESLNLVDGKRSIAEIRDWLTVELGPVPVAYVAEYLRALALIDVLRINRNDD